jgi:hypothetical protein
MSAIPNLKLDCLVKPMRECHEWANDTNFSKVIGVIRYIRTIRVKSACLRNHDSPVSGGTIYGLVFSATDFTDLRGLSKRSVKIREICGKGTSRFFFL